MKIKPILLIVAVCLTQCLFGQSGQTDTLKDMYENGKYDEIINYKPKGNEELAGKSLYYIGMAYYMKQDDDNALKYLGMALKKGPVDSHMYYYNGMEYFYTKKYNDAIAMFDKAIALVPNEPGFYGSKGDAYSALDKIDSALVYFRKATTFIDCEPKYYRYIGDALADLKKYPDALAAYKIALKKTSLTSSDEDYKNCCYNIGLMQEMTGDSLGAKSTFRTLVSESPNDYHAIAKLIQAYYANKEYEMAKPYKAMLYDAHKKDSLPDEMKKMFCFDQFLWNGKKIMAFEHYDEPADVYMYIKHTFYILNDSGEVDYRVQSESDEMMHKEHPDEQYVLCLVNSSGYHTYWNFIFNDDVKYPDLKNAVLNILNEKSKPGSETIIGK